MMRTRSTQTGKMNLFETEHRDDPTGSTGGSGSNLDREEIPLPEYIYNYIYIYIIYYMNEQLQHITTACAIELLYI